MDTFGLYVKYLSLDVSNPMKITTNGTITDEVLLVLL